MRKDHPSHPRAIPYIHVDNTSHERPSEQALKLIDHSTRRDQGVQTGLWD